MIVSSLVGMKERQKASLRCDYSPELARVSTRPLPAVGSPWWETGVALSADLLVTVVLGSEDLERWLDDTSTETGAGKVRQKRGKSVLGNWADGVAGAGGYGWQCEQRLHRV